MRNQYLPKILLWLNLLLKITSISHMKHQVSETAIEIKFAQPYASLYMD